MKTNSVFFGCFQQNDLDINVVVSLHVVVNLDLVVVSLDLVLVSLDLVISLDVVVSLDLVISLDSEDRASDNKTSSDSGKGQSSGTKFNVGSGRIELGSLFDQNGSS